LKIRSGKWYKTLNIYPINITNKLISTSIRNFIFCSRDNSIESDVEDLHMHLLKWSDEKGFESDLRGEEMIY